MAEEKIPDLYKLLGLEAFEVDAEKIQEALKKFGVAAKKIAASDPQKSKQLGRIFQLGKEHLLKPKSKANYDQRLRRQMAESAKGRFADSPSPSTRSSSEASVEATAKHKNGEAAAQTLVNEAPDWDWSLMDGCLPNSDPTAEFDMASFLKDETGHADIEADIEQDFAQLMSLVGGVIADHGETPSVATSTRVDNVTPPVVQGPIALANQSPQQVQRPPVGQTRSTSSIDPRKRRRKRERNLLLMTGGILFVLAGVLAAIVLWPESVQEPQQVAANEPAKPISPTMQEPVNNQPVSSGLPKVKGLDDLQSGAPTDQPMGFAIGQDEPQAPMNVEPPMNMGDTTTEMDKPEPEDEGMDSPLQSGGIGNLANTTPTKPPPIPKLTDEQKKEWRQQMDKAKEFLGTLKFSEAKSILLAQRELALLDEQKRQLERLEKLAELSEGFNRGLVEAILAEAGNSFFVKSTEILLVEGGEDQIVIRRSGQSETFALTELPMGIAFGLADLKLDLVNSRDLAKRAAFAIVHPKSNELVMARARKWLSQAIADEVVPDHMLDILDDDYTLP